MSLFGGKMKLMNVSGGRRKKRVGARRKFRGKGFFDFIKDVGRTIAGPAQQLAEKAVSSLGPKLLDMAISKATGGRRRKVGCARKKKSSALSKLKLLANAGMIGHGRRRKVGARKRRVVVF